MKKKIGECTLRELLNICKKYGTDDGEGCWDCPLSKEEDGECIGSTPDDIELLNKEVEIDE